MQFGLAFGYFLNKRGGTNNLLMLVVCQLIPVVGPIVGMGYRAEVAERLIRDPDLRRHPNFDFNRFMEYLTRGVWPFITGLLLGLAFLIPMMLAFGIGFGLAALVHPFVGLFAGGAIFLFGWLGLIMLQLPMVLHAELTAKFDFGGAYRFAVQFWKLVGGQAIQTGLLFLPLSVGISLLGMLLCYVGLFPAIVILNMAAQHLMVQLYLEYVARGGEPITKDDPRDDDRDEYDDRGRDRDDRGDRRDRDRRDRDQW